MVTIIGESINKIMADDHRKRFNNLAKRFDINKDSADELEKSGCNSVVALTYLTEGEVDGLLKDFSLIGQRSCIRGAITFVKELNLHTPDCYTLLRDSESVINHKANFRSACSRGNLKDSTINVLHRYGCDSIPALQFLHQEDLELSLLANIEDIDQKSALRSLISNLKSHKSVITQTTSEPPSDGNIEFNDVQSSRCSIGDTEGSHAMEETYQEETRNGVLATGAMSPSGLMMRCGSSEEKISLRKPSPSSEENGP